MLTPRECEQIFETYLSLSVAPEETKARIVTERLNSEQLEWAAMRSYAYFVTKLRDDASDEKMLTDEIQFACAMREANRHLDGVDEVDEAFRLLGATLEFHKERKTNLYRTCMMEDFSYANEEDAKLAKLRRHRIIEENRNVQAMVIRGHDRHKNAVWVSMPRKQQGEDPEAFVDTLLYTIERCLATTEAISLGRRDKMVSILDCKQSSAPSIKAVKLGISALQAYYPGRLKNLIALDLNYILQGIYNCVKPFLDPETRAKFIIVKGTKAKEAAISMHIDASQALPHVLKNGKLSSKVDGEWFVKNVPFCRLYDAPNPPSDNNNVVVAKTTPQRFASKEERKIPAPIKSPRIFRSKSRTLAVGHVTRCMTRVSVTPAAG